MRFWHALYKKEGTAGMLAFLRRLDPAKLNAFPMNSPEYRELLSRDDRFKRLTR